MSKVLVKSIDLTNFKGFAKLHKDFDKTKETIMAENGQGKTTLKDAFFWVLGFNHIGNVIPSKDNKEIPNLEIKATLILDIDGVEYVLDRTQREVWKTNKDTGVDEKMNNESIYSMDGIEYIYKNYKAKIGELFGVDYEKLLMLSEKEFFNSNTTKWGWAERRRTLFELCDINNILKDLVENEEYSLIKEDVRKGYSTTEIKKSIAKEQKGYKEEKERNLILVSDKQNDLSKYNSVDFESIDREKTEIENKITELSLQSAKQKVNSAIAELEKEKSDKEIALSRLKVEDIHSKSDIENKSSLIQSELKKLSSRAEDVKEDIRIEKVRVESYEKQKTDAENSQWNGSLICPTCKQPLPETMIETAKSNFELEKTNKLNKLEEQIKNSKSFIDSSEKQLDQMRENYKILRGQYDDYQVELTNFVGNPNIAIIESEIESIKSQINNILKESQVDKPNDVLIDEYKDKLKVLNEQLSFRKIIQLTTDKIEELRNRNLELTDKEMLCKTKIKQLDAYIQAQVKLVTDIVNSKFENGVSFSLFNELYANSEHEVSEECICVLNGKTYDEMSYGEKFIADLEVTKTLQREHKVNIPLFLDNAECVTRDYFAEQQLIELFASRNKFIDGIKIETIL